MVLTPLQDYVLCELQPSPPASSHLIVFQHPGRAQPATIVAVGPEVRDLTVGANVLISRLAGMEVQDKVLLREESILATL